MPTIITCPTGECGRQLRVPDDLLGKKVKCPSCGTVFAASAKAAPASKQAPPAKEAPAAPPPKKVEKEKEDAIEEEKPRKRASDVLAQMGNKKRRQPTEDEDENEDEDDQPRRRAVADEDDEEEDERPRRRARADEDEDEEDERPRRRRSRSSARRGGGALSSDYSISPGDWFNYAWGHYGNFVGPMIGFIFLAPFVILGLAITIVGILAIPALMAGPILVAMAELKGERWTFGDFFGGFKYFGSLLGNVILTQLIALGCVIPGGLIMLLLAMLRIRELAFLVPVVMVITYLAMIFVLIRISFFSMDLILDRDYGPLEAIQGSWTLTRGHFWGVFGMSLLIGLIAQVGALACGIGVLFTVPLAILMKTAGYLLIAGSKPPVMAGEGGSRRRRRDEDDEDDY